MRMCVMMVFSVCTTESCAPVVSKQGCIKNWVFFWRTSPYLPVIRPTSLAVPCRARKAQNVQNTGMMLYTLRHGNTVLDTRGNAETSGGN